LAEKGNDMTTYQIGIKKCQNCGCESAVMTVATCNTIDAKFYSDGFLIGPMYTDVKALFTCPACNKYFWQMSTRKSMPATEYFRDAKRRALPEAKPVYGPLYEDALHQAPWKTSAQEKYLRIRAWWSFNSAYRGKVTKKFIISPEQETNLLRLLQLLDANNPDESIMKAEIFRELGHFDECLKQLDQPVDDKYRMIVDTIKKLATCKKRQVVTIF
jgi:hypothetical protein